MFGSVLLCCGIYKKDTIIAGAFGVACDDDDDDDDGGDLVTVKGDDDKSTKHFIELDR